MAFEIDGNYVFDRRASLEFALRQSVATPLTICRSLFFRHKETGELVDVMGGGDRSCAKYVSLLLISVGLVGSVRAKVDPLRKDLIESGWQITDKPGRLRVVVWGRKEGDDGFDYDHIGICRDEKMAYCNNPASKLPEVMPIYGLRLHNGDIRPVECFYEHPELRF